MDAKQICKGDRIQDKLGQRWTVRKVKETNVIVYEEPGGLPFGMSLFNISEVTKRYWSETLQKYVAVPGAE